jgi:hypothetical protein
MTEAEAGWQKEQNSPSSFSAILFSPSSFSTILIFCQSLSAILCHPLVLPSLSLYHLHSLPILCHPLLSFSPPLVLCHPSLPSLPQKATNLEGGRMKNHANKSGLVFLQVSQVSIEENGSWQSWQNGRWQMWQR